MGSPDVSCPVCLGSGDRLGQTCGWCRGLGIGSSLTKSQLQEHISNHMAAKGYSLIIEDAPFVTSGGLQCSAFFDLANKVVVVAGQSVNYFENLLHEYCHFMQHLQQTQKWKDTVVEGVDSAIILEGYLEMKVALTPEELEMIILGTIEMEWECETMAMNYLRVLTDYDQENLRTYMVNAFLYMRFYRAVQHFGSWYIPGKDFYSSGIHHKYATSVKNIPAYNAPITAEEIEVFEECFK